MASKRMFAMQIIDSDAFLDMPSSTQNLYFHLNMRADDEGFIDNPRKIMRMIGASQDDMNVLITKRFVIHFESGIVVIKHWLIHNYIRQDRLTPTVYTKERELLEVKDNKSYTERQADVRQLSGNCQADVSIDKIRLDKVRLDKINTSCPESDDSDVSSDKLANEIKIAEQLAQIIKEFTPTAKVPKSFIKWAEVIDRTIRIDKRTPDQIIWLFRWAQNNDFWNRNIRSPDKLRKHWDRLVAEAKAEQKPKKQTNQLADRLSGTMAALKKLEEEIE